AAGLGPRRRRAAPARLSALLRPHRRHPRHLRLHRRGRHRPRGRRGGDPPAPGRMVHTGDRHRRPADRRRRGPRPMTPPRTAPATSSRAPGIPLAAPPTAVLRCPIADGGDGTVDAALAAGSTAHSITVTGPTGEARRSRYALAGDVAVVELAETVGLAALPGGALAPHTASTRGLGELIAAAVAGGARTVVGGLGGSSPTPAGAGRPQGLGARRRTTRGEEIAPGTEGLAELASADLAPALEASTAPP